MAVVRIKLDRAAHLNTAEALKADAALKRAAREIRRAADRPGLLAELGGPEVRAVLEHRAALLPRVRKAMDEAAVTVAATEERDRTRPRARDLALAQMVGTWPAREE